MIRLAAYLFDQPNAAAGAQFANGMRNSGAARILLPYRVVGLGVAGGATGAGPGI